MPILLVAGCTCGNSNKTTAVVESVSEQMADPIVCEAPKVVQEVVIEPDYIMTPGVTYVTISPQTNTDGYGGKVNLSMEFTIYKDGTASGNLIETNDEEFYGNSNSYRHPIEGKWREVSKHDKRFVEIKLILEGDEYYNWFYYYVDENLNAYANDINTTPMKLEKK